MTKLLLMDRRDMKPFAFKRQSTSRLSKPRFSCAQVVEFYTMKRAWAIFAIVAILLAATCETEAIEKLGSPQRQKEQKIPILGVTTIAGREIGIIAHLVVTFAERTDRSGLAVVFPSATGRLSPMAETSIQQSIYRAARVAGLTTDSWSVTVSVLDSDLTIHGSSLSAMVSMTVLALAKGHSILPDRVITGAIAPDGFIHMVGGVPLKLEAAQHAHYKRVLVPEETSITDGDWHTPFLMHVSPVSSLHQAYLGLTGLPLFP